MSGDMKQLSCAVNGPPVSYLKAAAVTVSWCCSLSAQERTIRLEAIGQRTKLDVDGVEFLLMKTLSLHLIEGIVDQVDGNVKVYLVLQQIL